MAWMSTLAERGCRWGLRQWRRFRADPVQYSVDQICTMVYGFGVVLLHFIARYEAKQRVRRSLWAGTPIINMVTNARADRLLGVKSDTLVWTTYFLTDAFTFNLSNWKARCPTCLRDWLPWFVLLWACFRYQRFHFYCDQSITPSTHRMRPREEELALLRSLGKEIYFQSYGADVRTQSITRSLGEPNCCTECVSPGVACICSDEEQQKNYDVLLTYATGIFSGGDGAFYTPGSHNDAYFLPIDLDADNGQRYRPVFPDPESSTFVRVVHAPNHRSLKGTQHVVQAVERMRQEGLPIEIVLVEKVPNQVALDLYRTADIIFDQCLIGWHGYFALEALALGKPVMVFLRNPENELAPEECPFINSPAHRVEAILRDLVHDRRRLFELGQQGRQYVEKYFTLQAFALRLKHAYKLFTDARKNGSMKQAVENLAPLPPGRLAA